MIKIKDNYIKLKDLPTSDIEISCPFCSGDLETVVGFGATCINNCQVSFLINQDKWLFNESLYSLKEIIRLSKLRAFL